MPPNVHQRQGKRSTSRVVYNSIITHAHWKYQGCRLTRLVEYPRFAVMGHLAHDYIFDQAPATGFGLQYPRGSPAGDHPHRLPRRRCHHRLGPAAASLAARPAAINTGTWFIGSLIQVSSRSVHTVVGGLSFLAIFGPGPMAGIWAITFRSIESTPPSTSSSGAKSP